MALCLSQWHPICPGFFPLVKDVYPQERPECGSSPDTGGVGGPDLFTPMEYSSVPGILGSIPIDEYRIDFHYQEDRMTFLKVCGWALWITVSVWQDFKGICCPFWFHASWHHAWRWTVQAKAKLHSWATTCQAEYCLLWIWPLEHCN